MHSRKPLKQPLLKKSLFRRLRQPLRRLPHRCADGSCFYARRLYDACRRKTHGKQRIVCNSGCRNRRRRTYHETRCHRCLKEHSAVAPICCCRSSGSNRPLLNSAPAKQATPVASLDGRPEQRVPMSRLRARVAERLVESQSTAPF